MSINPLFTKFIKKIRPTKTELKNARKHRKYLEYRLTQLDLGIFKVKLSGSFAKGTHIRPLKDIDVIFYIEIDDYPHDNINKVLHQIARKLRPSYPHNTIKTSTRSVKLTYSNGFSVDIIPALSTNKRIDGAEILDRETGHWIKTSIPKHISFANRTNKRDNRYKTLVRMFKVWKGNRRRNYPSFFISLLIAEATRKGLPKGWENAIFKVFDIIKKSRLNKPIYFTDFNEKYSCDSRHPVCVIDPANPSNNVAKFMTQEIKTEFLNCWKRSHKHAKKAKHAKTKKAKIYHWEKVFGDRFPKR